MSQVSLFVSDDLKAYEKLRIEALKSKRKRFKHPTFTKFYKEDVHKDGSHTDSEEKWGTMNRLYVELANRFPFPLSFSKCENIIKVDDDTSYVETGMIRTCKICYHKGKYKHKGDDGKIKEYEGEEFFYNYAEVIGTEDLGINERLFIHYWLIEYLDEGYPITKLNMWIENLVNLFKQGWTAELYIIFLLTRGAK
jgi:hypothetical protein